MIQLFSDNTRTYFGCLALLAALIAPTTSQGESITQVLQSFHITKGFANMAKQVEGEIAELDGILDQDPEAICMGGVSGALQCTFTNTSGNPDSKIFKSLNAGLLEQHSYGPFDYEEEDDETQDSPANQETSESNPSDSSSPEGTEVATY